MYKGDKNGFLLRQVIYGHERLNILFSPLSQHFNQYLVPRELKSKKIFLQFKYFFQTSFQPFNLSKFLRKIKILDHALDNVIEKCWSA